MLDPSACCRIEDQMSESVCVPVALQGTMWLVIRVVFWKEHLNCVWPNQELFAAQLFSAGAGAWVQEEAPAY